MDLNKNMSGPTLTSLAKSYGWAAKFSPVGLKKILHSLPNNSDPNVLVGFDTSDDAGVYLLNEKQALVFTADFISPPVDDPYLFGQIAAANSLSDIFAMGGTPISCLNLMGFPSEKLDNVNVPKATTERISLSWAADPKTIEVPLVAVKSEGSNLTPFK